MPTQHEFEALLPVCIEAVKAAGLTLKARFSPAGTARDDMHMLIAAIDANDSAVDDVLGHSLLASRPGSGWLGDDENALPDGEWWVVDPVEGNINHVQGGTVWGVTAALVRNGEPVVAVVYEPLQDRLYTATKGGGAYCNGVRLRVSTKRELRASLVGTGQAAPGEPPVVLAAISLSIHAMLNAALLVRMAVPATFEMVDVASGRMDAFWQYTQLRSGLAAGVLLAAEAGGVVTDTDGKPWSFASDDVLVAAPGVHAEVVACLNAIVKREQP